MWLLGFCDRYPARPAWNRRAVTALDNPALRRLFGQKIQPGQCHLFWTGTPTASPSPVGIWSART